MVQQSHCRYTHNKNVCIGLPDNIYTMFMIALFKLPEISNYPNVLHQENS